MNRRDFLTRCWQTVLGFFVVATLPKVADKSLVEFNPNFSPMCWKKVSDYPKRYDGPLEFGTMENWSKVKRVRHGPKYYYERTFIG